MATTKSITAQSTKQILRCIALAYTSAGFLFLSLPNPDQGWLAWIALVPLLIACRGLGPFPSLLTGLVCGIITKTSSVILYSETSSICPENPWLKAGVSCILTSGTPKPGA